MNIVNKTFAIYVYHVENILLITALCTYGL